MGERLMAGPDIGPLVDQFISANGDRQQIEAICTRRDMSHMEACALILEYDAKTAVDLLEQYGQEAAAAAHREAMRAVHAISGADGHFSGS